MSPWRSLCRFFRRQEGRAQAGASCILREPNRSAVISRVPLCQDGGRTERQQSANDLNSFLKMPVSQVQTPELILEPLFIEAGSYGNLGAFASGGRGRRSWGAWTCGHGVRCGGELCVSTRRSSRFQIEIHIHTCLHAIMTDIGLVRTRAGLAQRCLAPRWRPVRRGRFCV